LNPDHPKGKHKARVFQSVLGITVDNADRLYELVQQAAIDGKQLRTIWIAPLDATEPQLVSAFIKSL
jgi:hypothetical protein